MRKDEAESRAGREATALRIVLVRSAETDFARKGRLEGDVDVPLTTRGRSEARRIMEEVLGPLGGVDAVYTSENQGARETAVILAEANSYRIRVRPDLRGVSLGLWEGQLQSDVRLRHARMFERWRRDPLSLTPPQGEGMEGAFKRAQSVARSIRKKHKEGAVALVAPRTLISLIYCDLMGLPPGRVFQVEDSLGPAEVVTPPDVR